MPFVKANIEKERQLIKVLIKSSPEARKAAEEFDKEYALQKETNHDRQTDRKNKPN